MVMENKIIKEKDKEIISIKGGGRKGKGYVSYFDNCVSPGGGSIYSIININMDNATEFEVLGKSFTSNILDKLNPEKIYRMLVSVKYEKDGIVKGSSPMKSIMITSRISCKLILERIQIELIKFENEYELEDYSGDCFVG